MIPVFRPSVGPEEVEAVREVLESGWLGLGPRTREFETAFAAYVGTEHAVGLNSCSAALHLALEAAGVRGGEVVTSPMTFVATTHAILHAGAEPVFCDIRADTLNIDPDRMAQLISPRTRAIVVVHYGGYACDMQPILELARGHDLRVIEDAAHACGGEWMGRKLGGVGDLGCFSFQAIKNLTTGDGGMVTTDDAGARRRLTELRWLGISCDTWSRTAGEHYSWQYDVTEPGFKFTMNDIAAAIGLVQLGKLERANARRRRLVERYDLALEGVGDLRLPARRSYQRPAYHNYVIHTDRRDPLSWFLQQEGIATAVHYLPSNHYDLYRGCRGDTPVSDREWRRILTLPLYPDLGDAQQDRVIEAVRTFFSA